MSSTYRCSRLTINELFCTFFVGRDALNELKLHKQFENEYGKITISEDSFLSGFYISVELKNIDSLHIFPYLALIDVLADSCEESSKRFINENKRLFIYNDKNKLSEFFNDNVIYVPKLMLKDI